MECVFGNPLSEDDLFSGIDSEAPPEVTEHLRQCPYCAKRRDQMLLFEDRLHNTMSHPSRQLLLEYQFSLLDDEEADAIGMHLDDCSDCQAILSEYAQETGAPKRQQPAVQHTPRQNLAERLGELIVRLVPSPSPGIPRLGDGNSIIAASAPGISLFLSVEPDGDNLVINGQIIATDQAEWTNAVASFNSGESLRSVVMLNRLGQFRSNLVPAGTYRLRITTVSGLTVMFDALKVP
jgi:hypothetical protein